MTQKLKLTTMFLLVTSISFSQNVQKSDTTKNPPKQQAIAAAKEKDIIAKWNTKSTKVVTLDSTKQVTNGTSPQGMTEQVNPAVKGIGVVVKRNPGGGANITVTPTNEKGETTVNITEKGNYTFTLSQPTSTNGGIQKNQGSGLKGVKVGLGKNPPNAITQIVAINDKGETEFKDLEVGNYRVVIMQGEKSATANPVRQN